MDFRVGEQYGNITAGVLGFVVDGYDLEKGVF